MSWTQEQKSVIKCTDPLIVVNACAGSGKTATLLGVMRANPNKKILYIPHCQVNCNFSPQ